LKYYIIAGEASGDLHGANLIKALRQQDAQAQIRAWGGDLMAAQGAEIVKHYRDLAFMGFAEVLMNLPTILGNLKFCKQDIMAFKPNVLVLIDYPGFNMRIAEFAKKQGLKVVYYIAPQAWAWKAKRAHKLRRDVDQLLTILPFEKPFFEQYQVPVQFVGHPLLDAIAKRPAVNKPKRLQQWGLLPDVPVVALLPGSRKQEIKAMLPLMLKVAQQFAVQVVVAAAPGQEETFYQGLVNNKKIKVLAGRTYQILEVAQAALVTSGTATLEAALFKVPQVVCYRGNWLSYFIARQLVKIKYISLVNLIKDKAFLAELIQGDFNATRLQKELSLCLSADRATYFKEGYQALIKQLGGAGASANAAQIIYQAAQHEK
jgi:lipid-A-disaccharide synthase